ncbi:receptor kinase-like protein Xa21 [Rutidosis leptorrhynchoides]|uniref:receptor kinase-like protein Xa21 n=1 Tax=Rutidosis leptorrhynchoides TaxID=125765 RepID=UPI003A990990
MNSRQPVCSLFSSLNAFLFYGIVIFLTTNNTNATISSSSSYDYRNQTDRLALLSFKSLITHDPYGALTSWNTSFHFCDWSGVTCGKRHKRVIGLQLISQGLEGSLSPHVGNLSFLRELRLGNNSFHRTIPHELGRLFWLCVLNIVENEFSGVIPTNLLGSLNLETFQLGANELVGSIPKEISLLSKLNYLVVGNNHLTCGIPGITRTVIHFRESVWWEHSRHLWPFEKLKTILLRWLLQLRDNDLSGILPPSISNCSKLREFEMSINRFSGKLTIEFSKLTDINHIGLCNIFESREANEIKSIDSLNNCSKLEILIMRNCNFKGALLRSIGNLSDHLAILDLSENKLYGNLSSSIGNLVGLTHLAYNRLTGKISSTIGKLQKLQFVVFNDNQFLGPIPDTIGNWSMINRLGIDSNELEGIIPLSLGNCYRLKVLYRDNNRLSGNIPKQLLQLSSLSIGVDLSHNNLSGSLPSEIGDLKMLSFLKLSHNDLSGNIPSSLSGCSSLSYLYINDNLFQGMLQPSLSSMRGLVELDLFHNNLSGNIPRFLEGFSSLQALNMSFNDFEVEVPVRGVFANANGISIAGNRKLCGGLKRKDQPSQSSTNERFLKVFYIQLLKTTDGFSETSLIGKGGSSSIYKGLLEHDDRFVSVKVLHLQTQGARKKFIRECEARWSVRHRNLLKIITSCSSVDFQGNDFKALIYDYMSNGSLHDWIHLSVHASRLNLPQRINILIDIASALDYLHNFCGPTIVHCDLNPSNILLDDDMVAHVGDFGLTRFLETNSDLNSTSGVKGTIGYV